MHHKPSRLSPALSSAPSMRETCDSIPPNDACPQRGTSTHASMPVPGRATTKHCKLIFFPTIPAGLAADAHTR